MQRKDRNISGLRSRYRHQPTRRAYQGDSGTRQLLANRPQALPQKATDGITIVSVRRKTQKQLQGTTIPPQKKLQPKKSASSHRERTVQRSQVLRREAVSKPKHVRPSFLQRIKRPQTVLIVAGVVVFVFGVAVSIMGVKVNSHVETQSATTHHATSDSTGDDPSETDPGSNAVRNYRVAPDLPRRIHIPKIKVDARVKAMGVKNDNQLKAPGNIYDTGWYQKSAKPGENGAMLIDGHVHGRYKRGVFYNLDKLLAGDKITIERGDGELFTYTVVKSQNYPKDAVDMATAMVPAVAGKQGLNIITCSGELEGTSYEERLIVFAVRE